MTDTIMQTYKAVEQAMDAYNKALLDHVEFLRSSEKSDPDRITRLTQGAKAMRDSSGDLPELRQIHRLRDAGE